MHDDTYERDGINYDIMLVEQSNMFRATWNCTTCDESGGLLNACPTAAEALGHAKAHAFTIHHVPVHALGRS
jgi:hypothetical protein